LAHARTASLEQDKLNLGGVAARLGIPGLLVGVIALAVAIWKGLTSDAVMARHFFHSYLAAFSFFMALTLGALIFVLIQHASRAGWSVTVRRVAEGVSMNMFLMVLLLLPMFISYNGVRGIYWLLPWLDVEKVAHDEILSAKSGYLNPTFFAIRIGFCFVFWCWLAWFFASRSREQDQTGNPRTTILLDWLSAPMIIVFGFSLTSFAFDWIMALNPYWFSTIFGVYFFAGGLLSALSAIVLLSMSLQKRGLIGNAINHEHYHDLGKLMFAFTFFWGYIAFSQYMLIWYANMPEETQFFVPREMDRWASVSLLLLIVHLLIPFPGLLSRHVKRRNRVLAFWAVWSLCACAVDLYWLVVPNAWINQIPRILDKAAMPIANALPLISDPHNMYHITNSEVAELANYPLTPGPLLITALCFIGIGGLYVFGVMLALRNKPLVPLRDPRLNESLAFENI
jgi:hypothetical protein